MVMRSEWTVFYIDPSCVLHEWVRVIIRVPVSVFQL